MPGVCDSPPKFCRTTPEWIIANETKMANASAERAAANRLIAESCRAIADTNKTKRMVQQDVNTKLEQRVTDIKFWEQECVDYLAKTKCETGALHELVKRIEKAICDYEEDLHIAQQCLMFRTKRRGVDLVHDLAEMELCKEVKLLQLELAHMRRAKEDAEAQLTANDRTQCLLEKDIKRKLMAIDIDSYCYELTEKFHSNQLDDRSTYISPHSSSVAEWLKFSADKIAAAEKTRQAAVTLRFMLDKMIQVAAYDVHRQVETTNGAFDTRIQELRSIKEKLEDHLRLIKRQICEMEENIAQLVNAIKEKMPPLRLSHARLLHRANRPCIELCRDAAQYRLIEEVEINAEMVATLNEQLMHSRDSLAELNRKRLDLEEDISIKTNSLFIDEVKCMGLRKCIVITHY